MERLDSVAVPGMVGRFRPQQLSVRETWGKIPDQANQAALIHTMNQVRTAATTVTYINPLDPGDGTDTNWYEPDEHTWGTTVPAGRTL